MLLKILAYRQADRRLTEKSDTRETQASTLHPTPPIPVSHPHAGLSHPRTSRSLLTHSHAPLILTPIIKLQPITRLASSGTARPQPSSARPLGLALGLAAHLSLSQLAPEIELNRGKPQLGRWAFYWE
eukprot:scaffold22350_cov124-Isochrysis_galbana.AAC.1